MGQMKPGKMLVVDLGTGADVETLITPKIMPTYNWPTLPFKGDLRNLSPTLNEETWKNS
jgi:hypothetical protein